MAVQDSYGNYQPGLQSGATAFAGTNVPLLTGPANPNNLVTAPIGSIYIQITGGIAVTFTKLTGQNTNTGWV